MNSSPKQRFYTSIIDSYNVSTFDKDVPFMPLNFKFNLDDFQKRSIYRLHQNESVFVSAPTSSGKTVVALYAISQSLLNHKRAIYTSPIKALSNQKYREFLLKFGTVGILTGDEQINRDAPVLIMTTEILQSMLYKDAHKLNDVEIVIFDEFHYIANQERGSVWEESVIRMPEHINMAFLSATMPNAVEIADWISKAKQRTVFIEMITKRPVPLKHCIFNGNGLYTISDGRKDNFDERNAIVAQMTKTKFDTRKIFFLNSLIWNLQREKLLPALVFEFSIKIIENKTDDILESGGINLLSNEEKKEVDKFFNEKVLKRIPKEDQKLSQVSKIHNLLICGIGVHHSGIIPILKEAVEILLDKNLVKLVFCTSTIGMGLNLPVKTCIFTNISKHNGKEFQNLSITEYQQMSGRAGRRNIDDDGTSIICVGNKFLEIDYLKDIFCGEADIIKSQLQISFKMIINSFNEKGEIRIHDILRKSFFERSSNSTLFELNKKIEENKDSLRKIVPIDCPHVVNKKDTYDIEDVECGSPIISFIEAEKNAINNNSLIIEEFQKEFEKSLKIGMFVLFIENRTYKIGAINDIIYSDVNDEIEKVQLLFSKGSSIDIRPNNFDCLHLLAFPKYENFGSLSLNEKLDMIDQFEPKNELNTYSELMKSDDARFIEYSNLHKQLILDLINSPCLKCESVKAHFKTSKYADSIRKKIKEDEETLKEKEFKECGSHIDMLSNMRYINERNGKYSLGIRGKIANKIYGHEIISTGILLSDIFDNCTPEETAALCSCLVAQRNGKNDKVIKIPSPKLGRKVEEMKSIVLNVIHKMRRFHIKYDENDFMNLNVNEHALAAVYDWANGKSFSEIMECDTETIHEGQMIYIITKDISLLTNFFEISKDMENHSLANKFIQAAKKINKGIVAAKSIYLYE